MKKFLLTLFLCFAATVLWAQDVVIDKLLPGRLGVTVLKQVNSFDDVRSLTILSGKANSNDLSLLQNDFPNVQKIDLGGLDCEFLEGLYDGTFGRKESLSTIILPQNLRVVPSNLISYCKKVESIDIPASVVHIQSNAFSNSNLRNVTFHDGLLTIGNAAFYNCDSLKQVTLPSTLLAMSQPFCYCDNLHSITCLAPTPPYLYGTFLGYEWMESVATLYTPPSSNYRVSDGWNYFTNISETATEPVKDIRVVDRYVPFPFPQNKPNLTLGVGMDSIYSWTGSNYTQNYAAHVTLRGEGSCALGNYNHELNILGHAYGSGLTNIISHYGYSNSMDAAWPSLLTMSPVTATDVSITHRYVQWHYNSSNIIWAFTSLPFDVRLSDLVIEGKDLQYSIMKYSGQMRADARFDDVWVRQTADSTLHAGEGFIVAVGWNRVATPQASIRYTAPSDQRTAIFNTDDAIIPLRDYAADYECDRGWNFVGNPYPCHFATKYFDLTGPFTVYENGRYKTYSPIDDDYVLRPFEGFFVQKPWGHDHLKLYKEGRFLSCEDYDDFKQQNNAPRHAVAADRRVVNILLTQGDEEQDRTRLVISSEAQADYEPMSDAVKFPAIDEEQTQLWLTGHDGTRYAISEQPLSDGEHLALDLYLATEGDYTLAFDGRDLSGLLLIDLETGDTQPMTEPYTFHATAGSHNGRFHINRADGGGDEVTYQEGRVTIDGITYQLDKRGLASVQDVTTTAETLEIPAHVTYQGATYTVYYFYHYTNTVSYKHLILPPTITSVTISRGSPKTLETVTSKALCPPGISYTGGVRDTTDNYTWYVPKAAVNRYKSSPGYRTIPHILPMQEDPQELWAYRGLVQFDDNTKPHNKPALYAFLNYDPGYYINTGDDYQSSIEVEGTRNMNLSKYEHLIRNTSYALNTYRNSEFMPTLISNSPMTADHVVTYYYTNQTEIFYWPMLCLPYDIRPSDITGDFRYCVATARRYDGARRAANGVVQNSNHGEITNWKNVGNGEIIPAGEGFILSAFVPYQSEKHMLKMPAVENDRRNGIFATSRTITLKDYPSARSEDRGWNLVGNAYPAFYDMSESDIATPYIVWGTQTLGNQTSYHYFVFTRDDDDFLLQPFQGFFVQYTNTQHEIHLPGSGRYHGYQDFKDRRPAKAPRLSDTDEPVRHLFDILLTGCDQYDRTRVVLNEEASTDFEPTCDATQIPVTDASLLCTIDGGRRFAINERPMPQGSITMGLDIAIEGDYTLSLGKTNSRGITLTDNDTGRVTRLDEGDYTFHVTAGRHDARFTLSFEGLTHIGDFTLRRPASILYDLQGRPVTGTPTKGIYIQNGKKVVIR